MKSYRIYINNNSLFIADSIPKQIEKIQQLEVNNFDFLTFHKGLVKGGKKDYILISKTPKLLFKNIKKKLTIIKAAGGLVKNDKGEVIFQKEYFLQPVLEKEFTSLVNTYNMFIKTYYHNHGIQKKKKMNN